jgi:hypothetical protein
MINPTDILDALIAKLREIEDLVEEMDGDENRIYAFHSLYPKESNLAQAIFAQPVPSILAVWNGTGPGNFGRNEAWKHQFTLYLRARETDEATASYAKLFRLLTKGVPASTGLALQYSTVHADCLPMDTPTIARDTDQESLDYFAVSITFTEIGDE